MAITRKSTTHTTRLRQTLLRTLRPPPPSRGAAIRDTPALRHHSKCRPPAWKAQLRPSSQCSRQFRHRPFNLPRPSLRFLMSKRSHWRGKRRTTLLCQTRPMLVGSRSHIGMTMRASLVFMIACVSCADVMFCWLLYLTVIPEQATSHAHTETTLFKAPLGDRQLLATTLITTWGS